MYFPLKKCSVFISLECIVSYDGVILSILRLTLLHPELPKLHFGRSECYRVKTYGYTFRKSNSVIYIFAFFLKVFFPFRVNPILGQLEKQTGSHESCSP